MYTMKYDLCQFTRVGVKSMKRNGLHYLNTSNAEKYNEQPHKPRWHEEEQQNKKGRCWYDKYDSSLWINVITCLSEPPLAAATFWDS